MNLPVIAGAYKFFIRRGEKVAEAPLIKALNRYGSPAMAADFLNSGNARLIEAGLNGQKLMVIIEKSGVILTESENQKDKTKITQTRCFLYL